VILTSVASTYVKYEILFETTDAHVFVFFPCLLWFQSSAFPNLWVLRIRTL
jgi:hypothetical protein